MRRYQKSVEETSINQEKEQITTNDCGREQQTIKYQDLLRSNIHYNGNNSQEFPCWGVHDTVIQLFPQSKFVVLAPIISKRNALDPMK